MGHRHRQLLLFLAVMILPGIMIAVQGWKLADRDEQLAEARFQKQTVEKIGQELLTRLERIKTQAMADTPTGSVPSGRYSDPALAVVGWADGESVVLPWDDVRPPADAFSEDPEYLKALQDAARAELVQQFDVAAGLYRGAYDDAGSGSLRAAAGFGLARTLARQKQPSAAASICRDLLKLPSAMVDQAGFSQWSSAATFCVDLLEGTEVLRRLSQDLDLSTAWSPQQLYRFHTLLESLEKSADSAIRTSAGGARLGVAARIKDAEEAQRLQKEYPKLRITPSKWQPYRGGELWLVGRAPEGTNARPLVIAVRAEALRGAIDSDLRARGEGLRFTIAADGAGEPLSQEYLPELRIAFPEGIAANSASLGQQQSLWGISFVLLAGLTLLVGYLLWRDMRREAHIAELRTQFVSSVSHELKTPLTSIRMFAELLQLRESNDAQQSRFLGTIVSESERLTRLLNNVLDFSRIERGERTYHLQPESLADVVEAAVRTIQYPLSQQGFVLTLDIPDRVPPLVVDRDAIQQAILNLLTNAIKYSGEQREIGLRLCAERDSALIQVTDRGIGIPEKEQSRIFQKFYRAPIPENRDISGTGLGLALVAHAVQAHGGTVEVKSKPGEGSTFSIRLPLPRPGEAERHVQADGEGVHA